MENQSILPEHIDLSFANAAGRDAAIPSPWQGCLVYLDDTNSIYIYDGAVWNRLSGWVELGRTTLGVAGDTLASPTFVTRNYLRIKFKILNTGALSLGLRFNSDSGSNYALRFSSNGAADTPLTSQTSALLYQGSSIVQGFIEVNMNETAQNKLAYVRITDRGTAGAAAAPNRYEGSVKWANTTDRITSVSIINADTGDMASTSEIIVEGKN